MRLRDDWGGSGSGCGFRGSGLVQKYSGCFRLMKLGTGMTACEEVFMMLEAIEA